MLSYRMGTFTPPVPYRMMSRMSLGNSPTGVSMLNLYFSLSPTNIICDMELPSPLLFQPMALTAPWLRDFDISGSTRSTGMFLSTPRPEHSGQAP